ALLRFRLERRRIEFRAGEERQHDGADAGEEFDPGLSVPSTAEPMAALKISCATVPTTISDSAVETRSQIESRSAINARLNQSAASAHTLVMSSPRLLARRSSRGPADNKNPPCGGSRTDSHPASPGRRHLPSPAGFGESPPQPPPRQPAG